MVGKFVWYDRHALNYFTSSVIPVTITDNSVDNISDKSTPEENVAEEEKKNDNTTSQLSLYTNDSDWSVSYPSDSSISSCNACKVTDPGVFVTFMPHTDYERGGWISIMPLANDPQLSAMDNLKSLARSAFQPTQVSSKETVVNGYPTLKVTYITDDEFHNQFQNYYVYAQNVRYEFYVFNLRLPNEYESDG